MEMSQFGKNFDCYNKNSHWLLVQLIVENSTNVTNVTIVFYCIHTAGL